MFDVEEVQGSSGTMVPAFAHAFAAVKGAGLRVAVTTSHSELYQCDTLEAAVAFEGLVGERQHRHPLPQLYSSGSEVFFPSTPRRTVARLPRRCSKDPCHRLCGMASVTLHRGAKISSRIQNFSFANFLLFVVLSRVFCVLLLLAFGQDVQLSMAAARLPDLPARSPIGRASP